MGLSEYYISCTGNICRTESAIYSFHTEIIHDKPKLFLLIGFDLVGRFKEKEIK